MSILYKAKPDEVKFIMVDPKRLELGLYADIPHLSTPIITDPKRAAVALRWAVSEMEKRYKDLAQFGVRNIAGFNEKIAGWIAEERLDENGDPYRKLPYVVIIIDELADLMMVSGKEVEGIDHAAGSDGPCGWYSSCACDAASVGRCYHWIDKSKFPFGVLVLGFRRKLIRETIIDGNGAESLLGSGDMLFLPPGNSQVTRVHGAFVDEAEIQKVVEHVKGHNGQVFRPEYDTTITKTEEELDDSGDLPGRRDPLFMDAFEVCSTSKTRIDIVAPTSSSNWLWPCRCYSRRDGPRRLHRRKWMARRVPALCCQKHTKTCKTSKKARWVTNRNKFL